MGFDVAFFVQSFLLGTGLAMDAFSVSMANGLNYPCMNKISSLKVAIVFALLQGMMPLIGWFCVSRIAEIFSFIQPLIPWIALVLLCYIGISMIREGMKGTCCEETSSKGLGLPILIVQGIATSIDALSAGFTISDYDAAAAAILSMIIAIITLILCFIGVEIGKRFGTRIAGKSSVFGGSILIFIGINIFIKSF